LSKWSVTSRSSEKMSCVYNAAYVSIRQHTCLIEVSHVAQLGEDVLRI
jgi:hypothetical protein